ncbi:MAG TPA: hypothetical protein VGF95_14240 [Solirubrobacteraceae bacterium]|jgi:hypothetical protein
MSAGISFRTERRAGWVAPISSGRFAGLEMMERQDAQAQQRALKAAKPSRIDQERQSQAASAEALAWVRSTECPAWLESYAVLVAMELRSVLGNGNVTVARVIARIHKRWPELFDNEKGAQEQ